MPMIGNVQVDDNVISALGQGVPPPRPGYGAILSAAAQNAYGQVRYGVPLALQTAAGTVDQNSSDFYRAGLARADVAGSAAPAASVSDLMSGQVGIGRFIGENIASSLPQTLSILGGSVVGGLAGGAPGALEGAVAVGTPQFVGSNVDRAVQENGGLSREDAVKSLLSAPVQAASDALVERYFPGAGHVVGDFAATQTGNFLTRTAKSIIKAGATEAVSEAGQQLGERFSAGLPVSGPDAAAEYVNAAVTAFAVGGTLGAAGGFRRAAADAKPANEVTNEDITAKVNEALGLPAPPTGPGSGQLALPAPDASQPTVQQRADVVVDRRGVAVPVTGSQVAAESAALAHPTADVLVNAAGEAAAGPTAASDLLVAGNTDDGTTTRRDFLAGLAARGQAPQTGLNIDSPAVREFFANRSSLNPVSAFDPSVPIDPNTSSTSALAQEAARGANAAPGNIVQADPVRPFAQEPLADLQQAIRAKDAAPALKQHAQDEITARAAEAGGDAPLTGDFQNRLADAKAGLRGGFVEKLTATDPADLVRKVYDEVFVNQNTASNVSKFAQRLGLLDDKLNPTAKADAIEKQNTDDAVAEAAPQAAPVGTPAAVAPAAAPVAFKDMSPAQQEAFRADSDDANFAAVQKDEPDLTRAQYDARKAAGMAFVREQLTGAPAAPEPGPVSITPAAADAAFVPEWKKLTQGLRTTEGGVNLAQTPPNLETAQASVFSALANDKVARPGSEVTQTEKLAQKMGLITNDEHMDVTPLGRTAYLSTPEGATDIQQAARQQGLTDPGHIAAFQQGVREQVTGVSQGGHPTVEAITANEAGKAWAKDFIQKSGVTSIQTDAIRARQETRGTGTAVDREQVKAQPLTPGQLQQQAQNRMLDAADLRTASDSDVAGLRRMVRDGAATEDVASALQRVQGGQTLFTQPEARPSAEPTRPSRGQPIFREVNTPTGDTTTRTESRVQSEAAVRAYSLRNLIEFARNEGGINDARAQKLHDLLDAGKVDQVATNLKSFTSDGKAAFGSFVGSSALGEADPKFEADITGKSFEDVAQHMIENAPSAYHREIMKQVLGLSKQIAAAGGHAFEIKIAKPGDTVPIELRNPDVRAFTEITKVPPKATIWLKGAEMGPETGMNYQLAAHEMLHAVTIQAVEHVSQTDPTGKTKLGKAVKDLNDLSLKIVQHLNDRLDNADRMTHTDFELAHALGDHNAFADPHEILSWGLTNPRMQAYLQSIEFKPKETVFSRLVGLVRNVLGLQGSKYDTALTELMRVSEQVLGSTARDLAPVFARDNAAFGQTSVLRANASEAGQSALNRTVGAATDATKQAAAIATRVTDKFNLKDLGIKARAAAFSAFSRHHMDETYGQRFPGMLADSAITARRSAIAGRIESMGTGAYRNFEALQRANPKMAKAVELLMRDTTQHQLDPFKAFEAHDHHGISTDANGKVVIDKGKDAEIQRLRPIYNRLVALKNDLSRGDGAGLKMFNEFRGWNEAQNYMKLATDLHDLVASDREFKLGVNSAGVNPMDTFMARDNLTGHEEVRAHWLGALNDQLKASAAFVAAKRGEVGQGSASDLAGMVQHLSPIEEKIAATHAALAGAARAPYFHLGRFGENYGSAIIRKAVGTNVVDPVAQAHVAQVLYDKGFRNIQINADNTQPQIAARFEKADQALRFKAVMLELHAGGWLDGGEKNIKAGPRNRTNDYGVATGVPAFVRRAQENLDSDPRYMAQPGMKPADVQQLEATKEAAKQAIQDAWIEYQPDSSISKVLTARQTRPGFDESMVRSWAHRFNVGARNVATTSTAAALADAHESMRTQAKEAARADNTDDPHLLSDLYTEVQKRAVRNPINALAGTFDKVRAFGHAYYLGLSPAFGAIQLMQVGTNSLPELAKQHGFSGSFHALRRASVDALALMKASTTEAAKLGPKHYADVMLTEQVLQASGLPAAKIDFLRQMIASGHIDIGQSGAALSQVARNAAGSKLDVGLKYASAIGMHTETYSRLVTALAAHDLHKGDTASAASYAGHVISEALFDYQNSNVARILGKQGFAGPITPLLTQFMSFSAYTTEKLYREAASAIGRARPGESAEATAQRASESRTYLLGHLTAMTALAGTLGLPFASVFATAIEKMVGNKDEPYDATASWRNFLASVLGKDMGEVVARGLPRAIGLDISSRVGEQDLLPFSQFLGDKRGWKEAVSASLGRSAGAAPEMLVNILDGGSRMGDGDLIGGMIEVLPTAMKNPLQAYRMGTEGYVDAKGNKLPMTPGAGAILSQLLGFTPEAKAEYQEARGDQQARRQALVTRSATLRQQIVRAIVNGDNTGAQELINKAQEFDAANPAFAVVPSLAGAVQRQAQSQAQARALGTPVGVPMQDIAGRRLTGYANVNYQ